MICPQANKNMINSSTESITVSSGRRSGKFRRYAGRTCLALAILSLLAALVLILIHEQVVRSYSDRILLMTDVNAAPEEAFPEDADFDCILILGALVYSDGSPSPMLKERLDEGYALYAAGVSPKIVVSGDHHQTDYDEVNGMKNYLIEKGVPSEDIFMDHAGFSTYESMYRMRDVFQVESMVIVTQNYHLYRALYIANELGMDCYGVTCDTEVHSGQAYREFREVLARIKDYCYVTFDAEPTYLGDPIPVSGDGNITND